MSTTASAEAMATESFMRDRFREQIAGSSRACKSISAARQEEILMLLLLEFEGLLLDHLDDIFAAYDKAYDGWDCEGAFRFPISMRGEIAPEGNRFGVNLKMSVTVRTAFSATQMTPDHEQPDMFTEKE